MKDAIKLLSILFFGLLTAIIIYPFLHELGHSIAAILSGAKILEFNLFPSPNVLCNIGSASKFGRIFIGLGGMMVPILFSVMISILLSKKSFWIWYSTFVLDGISLLSTVISIVAIILFYLGKEIINEDVIQILQMYPNSIMLVLTFILFLTIVLIVKIRLDQPIDKFLAYFGIKNKAKSNTI